MVRGGGETVGVPLRPDSLRMLQLCQGPEAGSPEQGSRAGSWLWRPEQEEILGSGGCLRGWCRAGQSLLGVR